MEGDGDFFCHRGRTNPAKNDLVACFWKELAMKMNIQTLFVPGIEQHRRWDFVQEMRYHHRTWGKK